MYPIPQWCWWGRPAVCLQSSRSSAPPTPGQWEDKSYNLEPSSVKGHRYTIRKQFIVIIIIIDCLCSFISKWASTEVTERGQKGKMHQHKLRTRERLTAKVPPGLSLDKWSNVYMMGSSLLTCINTFQPCKFWTCRRDIGCKRKDVSVYKWSYYNSLLKESKRN